MELFLTNYTPLNATGPAVIGSYSVKLNVKYVIHEPLKNDVNHVHC